MNILRRQQKSFTYNLTLHTKNCQIKSGRWVKFLWPSQHIWMLCNILHQIVIFSFGPSALIKFDSNKSNCSCTTSCKNASKIAQTIKLPGRFIWAIHNSAGIRGSFYFHSSWSAWKIVHGYFLYLMWVPLLENDSQINS